MKLKVENEFINICKDIIERNLSLVEWLEIESTDDYQTENYCGGFDSIEKKFCFSFYDEKKIEYWFQKPILEIEKVKNGIIKEFEIRLAE